VSEYSGSPAAGTRIAHAADVGAPLRERTRRQRARFTPSTSASEEAV
jgi:hypothetical protein